MQLDKEYYGEFIKHFKGEIEKKFSHNFTLISEEYNFSNRGFFRLSYIFLPLNYNIIIENEFRSFDIIIKDSEGASNVLNRMADFSNSLDKKNIENAIQILKELLKRNDFNFYFSVGDKIYKRNSQGIKRVKNIKEILNG